MARRLRLHLPGGFYHVTLRGNHRQPIFHSAADRTLLDRFVQMAIAEHGARLHGYCWMTNHIHMLLQIADKPLGAIIRRLASAYARTFQQHLNTTGHLFERRYHALLVDADAYLLTLIRYIHLNPVRAGLVRDPLAYPWSSHAAYLGLRRQDWVTTDFALRLLGADRSAARARYAAFMQTPAQQEWGDGDLRPNDREALVLGSDDFVARIGRRPVRPGSSRSLDAVLDECAEKFQLPRALITSAGRNRQLSDARAWLALEAFSSGIATISGIARALGRTEGAIRHLLERRASNDEDEQVRNVRPGTN